MSDDTYMHAALDLARVAGDVAMGFFRRPIDVEAKADGSPVTRADLAAESAALEWLEARFPSDGVFSEEFGILRPDAERQWIVDPIDGTKTFLRGVPVWGTLVAVLENRQVIAGAAYFPAIGESVVAAVGCGAWWNGARCHVSDVAKLAAATVLTTEILFPTHTERQNLWASLSRDVALSRTWGDCYGYLLVATGRAEAMVDDHVNIWDIAPWEPVIHEAGGVLTDWSGERVTYLKDAIATNQALSSVVRHRLGAN